MKLFVPSTKTNMDKQIRVYGQGDSNSPEKLSRTHTHSLSISLRPKAKLVINQSTLVIGYVTMGLVKKEHNIIYHATK